MGTNQVVPTYEYTVVSFAYKNNSPRKLVATTRKVMRPMQLLVNPKLKFFGLRGTEMRAIETLTVGQTHVDQFGDHWKRIA